MKPKDCRSYDALQRVPTLAQRLAPFSDEELQEELKRREKEAPLRARLHQLELEAAAIRDQLYR